MRMIILLQSILLATQVLATGAVMEGYSSQSDTRTKSFAWVVAFPIIDINICGLKKSSYQGTINCEKMRSAINENSSQNHFFLFNRERPSPGNSQAPS